jgi:hypothetical protein
MGDEWVTIDAPAEDHDEILLDRVSRWAAAGPVSFLRVNKPSWRLEIIRHDASRLSADATDAVADSALVLHLLSLWKDERLSRSRREMLLRAMRRVDDALILTREERVAVHRDGYAWAVELGRFDDAGMAALETRFLAMREGIASLLAAPCDETSEARWSRLRRPPDSSGAAIRSARKTVGRHANRLGVFAEAEAILHYFLFRLDTS